MYRFFLSVFLVAFCTACRKADEKPLMQPTTTDLLTRSQWREVGHTFGSFGTNRNSFTGGNMYDQQPTCRRDDFLRFNANQTVVFDEGASRCNSTDPQQKTDAWSLVNNYGYDQLLANLPHTNNGYVGQPTLYTIVELSETTLTVSSQRSNLQGGPTVEEVCYQAF
jgi:hypothetical protein